MKKSLLFLSLVAGIIGSCEKEENFSFEEDALNPIVVLDSEIQAKKSLIVSKQSGNTARKRLFAAYSKAVSGDAIIVDEDVLFRGNESPLTITKNGITIRGAARGNSKYSIKRNNKRKTTLFVRANNVTLDNLIFEGSQNCVFVGYNKNNDTYNFLNTVIKNFKVRNSVFKHSNYTGIDIRALVQGVEIYNTEFTDCPFSLQTFDCRVIKDFLVQKCTFNGGDHQISLDNALIGNNGEYENIIIKENKFNLTKRFNIALANVRNVSIMENKNMQGGTNSYSQPIHIEDRSSNITINGNTMKSKDIGILLYGTDKFGHGGNSRPLTAAEKKSRGSGNVYLSGNSITTTGDHAISSTYGKGYMTIEGNNILNANNGKKALLIRNSNAFNVKVGANAMFKGKRFRDIFNSGNASRFYQSDKPISIR